MYRIRLGCAAYARMNFSPDQARRMMYIVEIFLKNREHVVRKGEEIS
jgi:hypothetical protein